MHVNPCITTIASIQSFRNRKANLSPSKRIKREKARSCRAIDSFLRIEWSRLHACWAFWLSFIQFSQRRFYLDRKEKQVDTDELSTIFSIDEWALDRYETIQTFSTHPICCLERIQQHNLTKRYPKIPECNFLLTKICKKDLNPFIVQIK